MGRQPSRLGQHVAMVVPFAVGEVVLQVGGRDGGVGAADLSLLLGFVVAQGADYRPQPALAPYVVIRLVIDLDEAAAAAAALEG